MGASAELDRDAFQLAAGFHFLNVISDTILGETHPAPRGPPRFKRFQPAFGLPVQPIGPSECGYRHELVAAHAKEAFDKHKLQNIASDQDNNAGRDVTRTSKISGNRLD